MEPWQVEGGVDLIGTVIGWPFSQTVLTEIARTGICDVLDEQLVDDLQALDRFNDPAASELLVSTLELLGALVEGRESRIPELVDLVSVLHRRQAVRPLEELWRDVGTTRGLATVMDLVPVLLDPEPTLGALPVAPLDFDTLWNVGEVALSPRPSGRSPLRVLLPVLQAVLGEEQSWTALGNTGALLASPDSEAAALLELLPLLLELDPELQAVHDLAPLLEVPELSEPLLRVVETPALRQALATSAPDREGALPFYARLVVGGSLDAVLALLDWGLDLLSSES
jgi:hypothetical protein